MHYKRLKNYGRLHLILNKKGSALEYLRQHVGHPGDDCLLWPWRKNAAGYGVLEFRGRPWIASRVMAVLALGEPPFEGAEAAHDCCNPLCINPRHIRWATRLENDHDKRRHGTLLVGAQVWNAKLNDDAVRFIRRSELGDLELAKMFECSRRVINQARRGEKWKHVA